MALVLKNEKLLELMGEKEPFHFSSVGSVSTQMSRLLKDKKIVAYEGPVTINNGDVEIVVTYSEVITLVKEPKQSLLETNFNVS